MNWLLGKWFLALETKKALQYSSKLEEDTGYKLEIGKNEDGIRCYWLVDPYGDRDSEDYWLSFSDLIFDLSDLQTFYHD
tara:strand:- start:541 stop:777 length:237 start_codon:yes stop_codon:yes gene_type:complete